MGQARGGYVWGRLCLWWILTLAHRQDCQTWGIVGGSSLGICWTLSVDQGDSERGKWLRQSLEVQSQEGTKTPSKGLTMRGLWFGDVKCGHVWEAGARKPSDLDTRLSGSVQPPSWQPVGEAGRGQRDPSPAGQGYPDSAHTQVLGLTWSYPCKAAHHKLTGANTPTPLWAAGSVSPFPRAWPFHGKPRTGNLELCSEPPRTNAVGLDEGQSLQPKADGERDR